MKLIPLFFLFLGFNMCTDDSTTQKKAVEPIDKPTICVWEKPNVQLNWTMYKTSDKIAFSNSFQEISVNNFKSSPDLLTSLTGTTLTVNTQSVQFNGAVNKILAEYLFGHMMESDAIIFSIKSLDSTSNTAIVNLKMNNTNKDIQVVLTENENTVHLKGKLDLKLDFDAGEPLYFYKTARFKEHKGKDGKSVTWSDVSFEFVLKAKKKC